MQDNEKIGKVRMPYIRAWSPTTSRGKMKDVFEEPKNEQMSGKSNGTTEPEKKDKQRVKSKKSDIESADKRANEKVKKLNQTYKNLSEDDKKSLSEDVAHLKLLLYLMERHIRGELLAEDVGTLESEMPRWIETIETLQEKLSGVF